MFSLFSHLRNLFGARPRAYEANDSTERESIETTQTDTSYSKEVDHQKQPMPAPAPTWTIPLCGPLLNRLLSKNNNNTSTEDSKKEIEKDDEFVIINPFTDDDSSAEAQVEKEPRCDFTVEVRGPDGRRNYTMHLTEDMDELVDPNGIMFLVRLLEDIRDGAARDSPMRPSTRFSGDMIKTRAARWAEEWGKRVDEYLEAEKQKVEKIEKMKKGERGGE